MEAAGGLGQKAEAAGVLGAEVRAPPCREVSPSILGRVPPDQGEASQAGIWGPQGVSWPRARLVAVLSHAELSSGRGSGRGRGEAGEARSLTSSPGGCTAVWLGPGELGLAGPQV